ncbi:DUF2254 family protein [Pseudoblastomonas halimionae]|uniref:DUF2254 domain-containing protein n=1 Tax=Alteriqipengyuania halimionae TaxID=1926630 RepID=A0A6I4U6K1_9SPHN|nr:DUF2254 family protein [Alteriqipengyuania halimionae]MXP10493.1 DUF2254 domain-containing protein [Alteriqipengyuania halimionae]
MAGGTPLKGLRAWILHRLVANYWSLPAVAVLVAPLVAALVLVADRAGAGAWMHERGLGLLTSSDTAQDLTIAIVGVDAAFLTLYWSITLIVLTLAAGNLGVRLVDRWLQKGLVRLSMAGLTFCLVFSIFVLARIDPQSPVIDLPHFALGTMLVLQLVNISMLGVAIHDLGRTMFIDRSIDHIGTAAAQVSVKLEPHPPYSGEWGYFLPAPREGYVEGIDLERIAELLGSSCARARLCAAPGSHVLRGEPIAMFESEPDKVNAISKAIPLGAFRSGAQSTVFEIRLLVEIAARALSPGINDFYTALACADRLATAMAGQAENWIDEGMMPCWVDDPRFELPGQDFRGLFDAPLDQFRQAAADYPSVSIRMIENFGRLYALLERDDAPCGLRDYLKQRAQEICQHAMDNAEHDKDRNAVKTAFARFDEASPLKVAA